VEAEDTGSKVGRCYREGYKMRPIKFRAWDKDAKKMIMPTEICRLHFNHGLCCGILLWNGNIVLKFDLIQFTGLHWDNDILESKDGLRKYIVTYSNKQCKWWLKGIGKAWSDPDPNWSDYKHIGNVHESPELIEETK